MNLSEVKIGDKVYYKHRGKKRLGQIVHVHTGENIPNHANVQDVKNKGYPVTLHISKLKLAESTMILLEKKHKKKHLKGKQHRLDVDGDKKIEKSDLKKLRKAKKKGFDTNKDGKTDARDFKKLKEAVVEQKVQPPRKNPPLKSPSGLVNMPGEPAYTERQKAEIIGRALTDREVRDSSTAEWNAYARKNTSLWNNNIARAFDSTTFVNEPTRTARIRGAVERKNAHYPNTQVVTDLMKGLRRTNSQGIKESVAARALVKLVKKGATKAVSAAKKGLEKAGIISKPQYAPQLRPLHPWEPATPHGVHRPWTPAELQRQKDAANRINAIARSMKNESHLVSAIMSNNAIEAEQIFNSIMAEKTGTVLDLSKKAVAQNVFNTPCDECEKDYVEQVKESLVGSLLRSGIGAVVGSSIGKKIGGFLAKKGIEGGSRLAAKLPRVLQKTPGVKTLAARGTAQAELKAARTEVQQAQRALSTFDNEAKKTAVETGSPITQINPLKRNELRSNLDNQLAREQSAKSAITRANRTLQRGVTIGSPNTSIPIAGPLKIPAGIKVTPVRAAKVAGSLIGAQKGFEYGNRILEPMTRPLSTMFNAYSKSVQRSVDQGLSGGRSDTSSAPKDTTKSVFTFPTDMEKYKANKRKAQERADQAYELMLKNQQTQQNRP